jgi:RNA polymerase sigma-70 factor (ECF subfamily)
MQIQPNIRRENILEVTQNQKELIEQCKAGDPKAQLAFYELHYRSVFNTSYRITGNKVESEDIMQETFITAFDKLRELQDLSNAGGWLSRISRNKSLNYIQRKRFEWSDLKTDVVEESDDSDKEFEDVALKSIYNGMKELPEGYRTILNLYLFENLDHNAIGKMLGISASTSRSQYTRAKQKLRTLILHDHD